MPDINSEDLDDFVGEEVVDRERIPIGTLSCYWEHADGKPVLLGIDINGLAETTHVAPIKGAILDARKSYVVVAFSKAKIKGAPSLECACELDGPFEKKVFAYYGAEALGFQAMDVRPPDQRELRKKFKAESAAKSQDSDTSTPKV